MTRTQVKIEHSLLALHWLNTFGKYPDGYNSSGETATASLTAAAASEASATKEKSHDTNSKERAQKAGPKEGLGPKPEKDDESVSGGGAGDRCAPRRALTRRKRELSPPPPQQEAPFRSFLKKGSGTEMRATGSCTRRNGRRTSEEWQEDECSFIPVPVIPIHDVAEVFPPPELLYSLPGSDPLMPMRGEELKTMWN